MMVHSDANRHTLRGRRREGRELINDNVFVTRIILSDLIARPN